MTTTTATQATFAADVREFLEQRKAQEEFETTLDVVRTCFPELVGIEAFMQADPDIDDRWRVIVEVKLPRSHPPSVLLDQRRRFAERIVARLPPAQVPDPVCSLSISFAQD